MKYFLFSREEKKERDLLFNFLRCKNAETIDIYFIAHDSYSKIKQDWFETAYNIAVRTGLVTGYFLWLLTKNIMVITSFQALKMLQKK